MQYHTYFVENPPPEECFKGVSIDYSCTLPVDEGSAEMCTGDLAPDAQFGAWIAMTVLAAIVVALVVIGAIITLKQIRQ